MPKHTTKAPFAPGAQGRLAPQAEADPSPGRTTRAMAERHEALWLNLVALHKDIIALGAKKPEALVSDAVRVTVEGLLSDCAVYTRKRKERLPVAAPDLGGLAIQLGQALAALEAWQNRHTEIDAHFNCLMWRVGEMYNLPVMRLKPPAAAIKRQDASTKTTRDKLVHLLVTRKNAIYEDGFRAGLAARQGPPAPGPMPARTPETQTYPRARNLG